MRLFLTISMLLISMCLGGTAAAELQDTFSGTLAAQQEVSKDYTLPANAVNIQVVMTGTGDADLYTRSFGPPTTTTYDCRPYTGTSNESCQQASAFTGKLYVMVRGYSASSTYEVQVYWDQAAVSGDDCGPKLLGFAGPELYSLDEAPDMNYTDVPLYSLQVTVPGPGLVMWEADGYIHSFTFNDNGSITTHVYLQLSDDQYSAGVYGKADAFGRQIGNGQDYESFRIREVELLQNQCAEYPCQRSWDFYGLWTGWEGAGQVYMGLMSATYYPECHYPEMVRIYP
jgi:Bacterial pre-peptidase C-terminal domain